MGIPILSGRDFDSSDRAERDLVVVINETLARAIAGLREPLGSNVLVSGKPRRVVAVVRDVKHQGLDRDSGAEIYLPQAQQSFLSGFDLVLRIAEDPTQVAVLVRKAVRELDPNQALGRMIPIRRLVDRSVLPRRQLAAVVGVFAAAALLLAASGIYGVVSYAVAQRRKEIGIRMAIGARAGQVRAMVVRQAAATGLVGLLIGLAGALFVARTLAGEVYGITTTDPVTFAGIALGFFGVILLASFVPALRASQIDPMVALRCE